MRTRADDTGPTDDASPSPLVERSPLDDLRDMSVLQQLALRTAADGDPQRIYDEILAAAVNILRSDAGTVQLHDDLHDQLVIRSTLRFPETLASHFARVDAGCSSPCGIALASKRRSVVDFDIPEEDDPDGSARLHREAGILSAQSTPLVTRTGRVVGMVSTHWRHAHRPTEHELRFLDLLVRQAADVIDRQQAETELREREERQRFLLALSDRLSSLGDANEVMAVALEAVAQRIGADGGGYVDVEDEDTLIIGMRYAAAGMPPRGPDRTSAREITNGLAELMRSETGLFVEDLRTDPVYTEAGRRFGAQMGAVSAAAVPLNKDGRWVAYLYLIGKTARPWSASDRQLLRDVAERTWASVERARAEQALGEDLANNERLRELADELARLDAETSYRAVAETALQVTKGAGCTLWISDERSDSFRNVATLGSSKADWLPVARQLLAGDLAPKEPRATRTFLITAFGERTAGLLSVEWPHPHVCSQRELRFIDLLARQLATFLERQHAELVLRQSEQRLTIQLQGARELQTISAELLVEQNIESLYDKVVGAALALMRADAASMQGFERGENELRLLANRGFPPAHQDLSLRVGGSSELASGRALATGSRVIIEDVDALDAPHGSQLEFYRASGIRSVVSMPLRARRGNVIGMLSVHWRYVHVPTVEALQLLDLLGRQASDLVAQREQEQALRVSEDRHGFLLQLADLLRQQDDLDTLCRVSSRLVGEHFGADRAAFTDLDPVRKTAHIRPDWSRDGNTTISGVYSEEPFRGVIEALCSQQPLIVDDMEHCPFISAPERAELLGMGAGALATVPVVANGGCWTLTLMSTRPRRWTTDEIMLLHEAADRIWASDRRLRGIVGMRTREELLEITFESSKVGRFIWDVANRSVELDDGLRSFFAFGPTEQVSTGDITARLHPDDLPDLRKAIAASIDPEGPGELRSTCRLLRPDGSTPRIGCYGRVSFEGLPRRAVRMLGTVLPREDDEAQALASERNAIDVMSRAGIAEVDLDLRITLVSSRFAAMLGYERGELLGRLVEDITVPEHRDVARDNASRVTAGETSVTSEKTYARKDGSKMAARCTTSALRSSEGAIVGYLAIVVET